MAIDQTKLDEFLGRFVADLGAVFAAPAVVATQQLEQPLQRIRRRAVGQRVPRAERR